MRKTHLLSGLYITGLLSGCNSAEGLIPPADIGDTSMPAYEQTASHSARSAPVEPVYSQNYPPPQQSYSGSAQGYAESDPSYSRSAQGSLDAQAAALNSGAARSPAASAPLDGGPWSDEQQQAQPEYTQRRQSPPAEQETESQNLDQPLPPASAQSDPAPADVAQPQVASLTPASAAGQSIRFLPIIGAPVEKVTPLSRQLGSDARARGLTIKGADDNATDYILKGYFSAFADDGKVNVVYVWDVLDASGARLHRIQGQQSVPGSGADPWAAVPSSIMQLIATDTINQYIGWRQTRSG